MNIDASFIGGAIEVWSFALVLHSHSNPYAISRDLFQVILETLVVKEKEKENSRIKGKNQV